MNTDASAPRRRILSRLPWILLALSVALNLFFIGGVFWVRYETRAQLPPAERFAMVAHSLSLNADQKAAFDAFIHTLRTRGRAFHEGNRQAVDTAWNELAKPHPDDATINRTIDELLQSRRAYMTETSQALRAFLATLSDDQRTQFVALARRHPHHEGPPLLRRLVP